MLRLSVVAFAALIVSSPVLAGPAGDTLRTALYAGTLSDGLSKLEPMAAIGTDGRVPAPNLEWNAVLNEMRLEFSIVRVCDVRSVDRHPERPRLPDVALALFLRDGDDFGWVVELRLERADVLVDQAIFDDEVLTDYEIGAKSDLAGGWVRANVSAFYYQYKNMQVFNQIGPSTVTFNRDARIYGGE